MILNMCSTSELYKNNNEQGHNNNNDSSSSKSLFMIHNPNTRKLLH